MSVADMVVLAFIVSTYVKVSKLHSLVIGKRHVKSRKKKNNEKKP